MGSAHAKEMERKAEVELEEALDDPNLSPEERAVIEEQLQRILSHTDIGRRLQFSLNFQIAGLVNKLKGKQKPGNKLAGYVPGDGVGTGS